jgi:hypothetical protein
MEVPAAVGLQGVEAAGFQFDHPVLPVFRADAEIVHGTGEDTEGLSV